MIERISSLIEKAQPLSFVSLSDAGPRYENLWQLTSDLTTAEVERLEHARQLLPLLLEVVRWSKDLHAVRDDSVAKRYNAAFDELDAYCVERLPIDQPIDDAGKYPDERRS